VAFARCKSNHRDKQGASGATGRPFFSAFKKALQFADAEKEEDGSHCTPERALSVLWSAKE